MIPPEDLPRPASPLIKIAEVRYSMPDMLEELKVERSASSFSMEKLDQHEIGKLFKSRGTRAKSKK
jgi:DNA-binding transcriptional regulator GbsR (MarR family)